MKDFEYEEKDIEDEELTDGEGFASNEINDTDDDEADLPEEGEE